MQMGNPVRAQRAGISVIAGAACAALLMSAAPAWASDPAVAADEAIAAIEEVSPEVLSEAVQGNTSAEIAVDYNTDTASVSVPQDPSDGALLTSPSAEVGLAFPFAQEAVGEVSSGGQVVYDNGNSSVSVPVVREDGSLQVLTVIDGPDAPARYEYDLTLSSGSSVTPADDGTILLTNSEGGFVGLIMPAWAKDAAGNSVETWYEVSDSTVTQVVVHGPGTAYPVVADPWLGITLFTNINRDWYNGDWRYNGTVTTAGAVVLSGGGGVGGHVAGVAVFNNEGWAEWVAAYSLITNKPTLKQQYSCHVSAGVYGLPFTGEYNLERFRANRAYWATDPHIHHCNW